MLKPKHIRNKIKGIKINRDAFIFIVFLFMATLFWFLNVLSETYTAHFTIPVKFVNVPDNEAIFDQSHDAVKLKIKGGGYTILRQKIGKTFNTISIDVSKLNRLNNEGNAYLLPSLQRENIQNQIFMGLELETVEPDTFFIFLCKIERKTVVIRPNGDINPEKQFLVSGPLSFFPDSVEAVGPVNIIDTLKYVQTEYFIFDKIKEPIITDIELKEPNNITLSNKSTQMFIPIELFSEASVFVPITAVGLADSLIIKTFPSEIKVTYQAGISMFDGIKPSDFSAIVDAGQFNENERSTRLRVRIDKTPEYLHSYDYSPYFVEYILEKKY